MKNTISYLFLLLFLATSVFAQNDVDVNISAQVRPRFEVDNRNFNNDIGYESTTYLRSRLGLELTKGNISIFFQAQDSRVYGTEPSTLSATDNLDLHQGYLMVTDIFDLPVDVKAGRMELSYGNQRFLSKNNWSNVGRSFDGILVSVHTSKVDFDIFATQINDQGQPEDSLDRYLYGIYSGIEISENHKIEPFILWERLLPSNYYYRLTSGLHAEGELSRFFYETDLAFQYGGSNPYNVRELIYRAHLAAINIGYRFDHHLKPMVTVGVDYLSGDDNDYADYDNERFASLYSSNHRFYGYMDFFSNAAPTRGLVDIHGKFTINPIEKLKLYASFHIFNSAEYEMVYDYDAEEITSAKDYGNEIDITANYTYNKNFSIESGFSLFIPGKIYKSQRGGDDDTATWFYLMGTVTL